ncbi:MAG: hypothetical protein GY820_38515 [Gammaproteobacteria bacterium]|nr:hypothetical protein [Gammaproteobacteria bacterium]
MPTISVNVIKKQRKRRLCENCKKMIEPNSTMIRLFGNAHSNDPVYSIFYCVECGRWFTQFPKNKKLINAMNGAGLLPIQPEKAL